MQEWLLWHQPFLCVLLGCNGCSHYSALELHLDPLLLEIFLTDTVHETLAGGMLLRNIRKARTVYFNLAPVKLWYDKLGPYAAAI
jgi:hypothetical protein